jgi:uncharacterized membrane protein
MLYKTFDLSIVAMLVIFFAGYISIHSDLVGMARPFPVSKEIEEFWEVFSWMIFAALVVDVGLKYKKINNPKLFLKKHWLDIVMLSLIPVFAGFKIAKLSINLVKSLKMTKSGFKVIHSAKKIRKT